MLYGFFSEVHYFCDFDFTVILNAVKDTRFVIVFGNHRTEISLAILDSACHQRNQFCSNTYALTKVKVHLKLHCKPVIVGGSQVASKDKIAQTVKNRLAVINLNALDYMRMRTYNHISTGIYDSMGDLCLQLIVRFTVFFAEMTCIDDIIAACFAQGFYFFGGNGPVLFPDRLAVIPASSSVSRVILRPLYP